MTDPNDPVNPLPAEFAGGKVPLTKRELFAAMAFHALVSAIQSDSSQHKYWGSDGISKYATNLADALIAELSREEKP